MNKTKLLWIVLGTVAAVILVAAVIVNAVVGSAQPEPTPTPTSAGGGIIDPDTGEWVPDPTPTPTTTLAPEETNNPGGGDALGSSGDFPAVEADYKRVAQDFLTQYLQWNSDESPEARAARIAPYVEENSPLLTKTPGISLVDKNPIYDYKSKTSLTWIDDRYTGWTLPSDASGNELFIGVIGNYEIAQSGSGGRQNTFWESSGRWTVQFASWEGSANLKVVDVREPAYLPDN